MSHTNWWQQGRGNISRGSNGRGYPRYASQIYNQGNDYQSQLANGLRGGPFYGDQGHGFYSYYVGNEYLQSHPANSQRGGFFPGEQGHGFGYGRNEHQLHLANSQRGGFFHGGQGLGFGYVGHEFQSHPANNMQRGGFDLGGQGLGFSHVGNEHQSHPANSQWGGPFYRGHGFSHVGSEHQSRPANNQRGGSFNREQGRGFSHIGNEYQLHPANSHRGSSSRGFSHVGNERESLPSNGQRGGSFNRERGRGFSPVGNEHESHPTNSRGGVSTNREGGRGFSPVGNEGGSHPTNNRRGGSTNRERGRGFSPVGNERESLSNSQRGGSSNRERGRGFSPVGNERESPSNSQRGGSTNRERGRGFSPVGNERESPSNSQRGGSINRQRGRGSSHVRNEDESHPTNSQRGGFISNRERGRGLSQRGRGQHHKGNRVHYHSQGTSKDVGSSHSGHKESWRSGMATSKPTSIPDTDPHKKEEPSNEVVPMAQQEYLDFPFIEHDETVRLLPQFRVMFILRGLPGSGKSTIADAMKQCGDHVTVCSANHYHRNKDGEYVFRREALQETHRKCQKRAEKYAALNKPVIIIDNTNVKQSEMEPYIKLAKEYGYVVVLIEPKTPWKLDVGELEAKNIHNVPLTTISRRLEQYDEILPCYFGWFLSQADCVTLRTTAKDILRKCLQITDFQQCIKVFSGHSSPNFTVRIHNALFYYSIKHSDRQDYHVTACFSPRGKFLAGSPYHKSPAVGKALGEISQLSIIGCVITKDTFSARVSLTEKQRALWMNDNQTEQQPQRKRVLTGRSTRREHSVEEMTKSFQHLPLDDNGKSSERPEHCTNASTHITLGTRRYVSPVQAKYDVQTVVNYELSSHVFEEHTLQGDIGKVRKYSDNIWAVYFNEDQVVKVPVIFSGYYD